MFFSQICTFLTSENNIQVFSCTYGNPFKISEFLADIYCGIKVVHGQMLVFSFLFKVFDCWQRIEIHNILTTKQITSPTSSKCLNA